MYRIKVKINNKNEKRIFIIMKNEKEIVGTLLGFDDCVSKN
jgi:small nuclear ribonucleoprotein (snRNP)-like protein